MITEKITYHCSKCNGEFNSASMCESRHCYNFVCPECEDDKCWQCKEKERDNQHDKKL